MNETRGRDESSSIGQETSAVLQGVRSEAQRKPRTESGTVWSIAVGAMLLAVAALPAPALAGFTCGGTVGPGGTAVMATDINQCASNPVLTIVGPVTVDMAGHHVECRDFVANAGIRIIGQGAVVKNGFVYPGCEHQIVLDGSGHHEVHDMAGHQAGNLLSGTPIASILVLSDYNVVRNSLAALSSNDGIRVGGHHNVIKENYVVINARDGVRVVGTSNTIKDNIVTLSGADAFNLTPGADANTVSGNYAISNNGVGFRTVTNGSWFSGNSSVGNASGFIFAAGDDGVTGGGNRIQGNNAIYNQGPVSGEVIGGGFLIREKDDIVNGNRAIFNAFWNDLAGIHVMKPGSEHVIAGNTSLFHGATDLTDETAGCGTDHWSNNVFLLRNQACIH